MLTHTEQTSQGTVIFHYAKATMVGTLACLGMNMGVIGYFFPDAIPSLTENLTPYVVNTLAGAIASSGVRFNNPEPVSNLPVAVKVFAQVAGAAVATSLHKLVCVTSGHEPTPLESAAVNAAGSYLTTVGLEKVVIPTAQRTADSLKFGVSELAARIGFWGNTTSSSNEISETNSLSGYSSSSEASEISLSDAPGGNYGAIHC